MRKNKNGVEKKDGFMLGVLALMLSQVLIKMLGLISKIFLTNKKGFGDIGNRNIWKWISNLCDASYNIIDWCAKCYS